MKCQILFSMKNKKNISVLSAESARSMVSGKTGACLIQVKLHLYGFLKTESYNGLLIEVIV